MSHEHKHNHPHTHTDEQGKLVQCYHECKSQMKTLSFWVLMTLTFPLEHMIWEYIPPFSMINAKVHEIVHDFKEPVRGDHAKDDHDHGHDH